MKFMIQSKKKFNTSNSIDINNQSQIDNLQVTLGDNQVERIKSQK